MTRDEALAQYRAMLLIRRFEERCAQIYVEGKIGGFLHLYIGQEAVAVAAAQIVRPMLPELRKARKPCGSERSGSFGPWRFDPTRPGGV